MATTKKTATKKTVKKAVKKTAKRAPKKVERAAVKKEGNLHILYIDGNRRKAFRSTEDAQRYIDKRHLND